MSLLRRRCLVAFGLVLSGVVGAPAIGDTVILKNGLTYRGDVDKDNTIVTVYDGLKRVIFRDTKVSKTVADGAERLETFPIAQPLDVHAGAMPPVIVSASGTPWDEFGRRSFEYVGTKLDKPVRMTQAIIALSPKYAKFRGVDGFWQGQVATNQVPRESVLAILGKIDQKNQGERLKGCQFLIQAEWYPEALAALERLVKDFPDPDLARRVEGAKGMLLEQQARKTLAETELARKAQQPKNLLARLKGFPVDGAPSEVLATVREQLRREETQAAADQALVGAIRKAAEGLPKDTRDALKAALLEIVAGLEAAPDAVQSRFEAFRKPDEAAPPSAETRFARALSGWLAGGDAAVDDLDLARTFWSAREALKAYVASNDQGQRNESLAKLKALANPPGPGKQAKFSLDVIPRIARLMPPPLLDAQQVAPGKPRLLRVRDDDNAEPTEYAILLPPEYHPLRTYPALVVLHSGDTPEEALADWKAEASRRGYILIAPEYNLRGQPRDYRYTADEHAAVELALRDARKRFSIDSDRVFLAGQRLGANAAWDIALAHPDLFAGVAAISGLPAKYAWPYRPNAKRVPIYAVMGGLAPSENELIFKNFGTDLVERNYDITFVEYYNRGLEEFPEEMPGVFDWMDRRVRDTYPKSFELKSARSCDDRFYGVVIRDFADGRTVAPNAADMLGNGMKPASVAFEAKATANLLLVTTGGVLRLDVWFSPRQVDFGRTLEVRVNRKTVFKGVPRLDLDAYVEDLRIRGDRQQEYWMRVSYPAVVAIRAR